MMELYKEVINRGFNCVCEGVALMRAAVEDADDAKGRELIEEIEMKALGSMPPLLKHFKLME